MDMTMTMPRVDAPSAPAAGVGAKIASDLVFETCENCSKYDCKNVLRQAGLRPTRQRLMLGEILFSQGGRHITAEMLHAEATEANMQISLATVYNTLNQFTCAGLLRRVGVDGSKSFFDTNPTAHHHFFVDQEDRLLDIPGPGAVIANLPEPLPGHEISRIDIVVHLRRKQG
ncbi:MAG: transcriptional repressor [Afipia sp.]|jgi:Fur family iron response transcriptional regulator|nr:transcriptional repressor [Afipia sp.]